MGQTLEVGECSWHAYVCAPDATAAAVDAAGRFNVQPMRPGCDRLLRNWLQGCVDLHTASQSTAAVVGWAP